jgi:hypothetical protein
MPSLRLSIRLEGFDGDNLSISDRRLSALSMQYFCIFRKASTSFFILFRLLIIEFVIVILTGPPNLFGTRARATNPIAWICFYNGAYSKQGEQ